MNTLLNHIKEMRCPNCQGGGPFLIWEESLFKVLPSGEVSFFQHSKDCWSDNLPCKCEICDMLGIEQDGLTISSFKEAYFEEKQRLPRLR